MSRASTQTITIPQPIREILNLAGEACKNYGKMRLAQSFRLKAMLPELKELRRLREKLSETKDEKEKARIAEKMEEVRQRAAEKAKPFSKPYREAREKLDELLYGFQVVNKQRTLVAGTLTQKLRELGVDVSVNINEFNELLQKSQK